MTPKPTLSRTASSPTSRTGTASHAHSRAGSWQGHRIRAALATTALATLTLAGCATPPTDPAWQPREPDSISGLAVAGDEAAFTSIDPVDLPGITHHRATNTDVGIDLRWPELAGADEFNAQVEQQQWSLIDRREATTGASYAPQVQDGGLGERGCAPGQTTAFAAAIREAADTPLISTCEIVAAAGGMLGIRSRVIDGESDATVTTYYDIQSAEPTPVTDLVSFDDEALRSLWHESVKAIRTEAGQNTLWPAESTPLGDASREQFEAALAAGVLEPDGSFVIDVPGGLSAPDLDALPGRGAPEPHDRTRFTPDAIAPYLNETGRALLDLLNTSAWQAPQSTVLSAAADCALVPCVALTYDDGPNPEMAEQLDMLAERDATATFFFIGNQVAAQPDIVLRAHEDGHEVANHSWDHPDFTTLKPKEIRQQIAQTQDAIAAVTGEEPTLLRPPYGAYDDKVRKQVSMPIVMWDLDTLDWQGPRVEELVADVVANSQPGSIVLMHSIHDGTIQATPGIVDGLRDRGFELVTVTQLFDGAVPNGVVNSGR